MSLLFSVWGMAEDTGPRGRGATRSRSHRGESDVATSPANTCPLFSLQRHSNADDDRGRPRPQANTDDDRTRREPSDALGIR